ncbi:hypothetical protein JCM16303_003321 [Sporobolomyces ruberrimus]
MSSDEEGATTTTRRRQSGRVRKTIERLDPSNKKSRATKKNGSISRNDKDEEDGSSSDKAGSDQDVEEQDDSMSEPETDEGEPDEDFEAPKKSTAGAGGTKKRKSVVGGDAANGGTQKKRGRPKKGSSPATGASQAKKPRARKKKADADGGDEAGEAEPKAKNGKDFPIEDDNDLFNAVKSPNTALQTTADDWVESYKEDSGPAMAELVNFVLRCCGCNSSIDEHQAEDENGVVENLKDIVDEFKQGTDHAYPLISKSKSYKKFRSSLGQFLLKLFTSASEDILFSTSFYEHFQAWTHALSSSQIRALRHTATVIVLLSIDALTILEDSIRKEHSQAMRAKEAEEKRNRKDKSRLKDMEKQVQEIHERLEAVEAFEEEAYTSVFVNRYRDADYVIRAECIASLGNWMKLNPDHWIDGDYLRYIGWVLSDESKEARRDSIRALSSLYNKDNYIGKLHHFTDRFKGQLVDMAMGEHDLAVRVQAIQVVRQIDGHGLLDEEQRDEVAQLVFEKEKRVRNAAAELFKSIVDEEVEQRKTELDSEKTTSKGRKIGGKKAKELEEDLAIQIELKVVAELLVKYGKSLDGVDPDAGVNEDDDDDSQRKKRRNGLSLSDLVDAKVHRGRVALAGEALWDTVESLQDWEALLSYLLKDHSLHDANGKASTNGGKKPASKGKTRGEPADDDEEGSQDEDEEAVQANETELPESVKLTEEEETLAIELLVACLAKLTQTTSTSKKDKEIDEEQQASIARAVIDALPRLFAKHQTFPARMVDILAIPRLIQLDLYHDQRTAFETLWDDVKKQFLKHTDSDVLDQAVRTIAHFLGAAELSTENQAKLPELEEALLSSLRQSVEDKDIESATFEEDDISNLTACIARIDKLGRIKNIASLEDTDGGKQTSVWEILDSIVNRGRLGYKEEGVMVAHALSVLGLHLSWQLQIIALEAREGGAVEDLAVDNISARRTAVLEKSEEFAVGNETNAVEGVKEVALSVLLDIHFASTAITSSHNDPDKHLSALRLNCGEELQARCAGYIEAEIERFAEKLAEDREAEEGDEDDDAEANEDSGSDTEMEENAKKNKKKKTKGKGKKVAKGNKASKADKRKKKTPESVRVENARQQARLVSSQRFERSISGFVRAIHLGIFDIRHSALLLKYWGRLGATFDDFARLLMHDLRDEGNYGDGGDVVAGVIVESLQGALELYLDSSDASDEHLVSLGRNLVQIAVVRGAQLAVVSTIPAEHHLRIHVDALDFIVKRIKQFVETKRTDERNKALSFFKALAHLVFGLDGRGALKAKTTLDSLFENHEIEVSATSKTWEPVRAYQKRLVTNMAKDPSIKSRAQAQAKTTPKKGKGNGKGKGKQTDDDEDELEDEDRERTPSAIAPIGTTPTRSSARGQKRQTPDLVQDEGEDEQEEDFDHIPSKRIRTEEPEEVEADEEEPQTQSETSGTQGRREPESVKQPFESASGDLDNTPVMEEDERPIVEEEEEGEVDEGRKGREASVDSVMSLSDIKKRKRRGRK